MTNLLTNPGFEGEIWRRTLSGEEFGEIFVPDGWVAYWREGGTVCEPGAAGGLEYVDRLVNTSTRNMTTDEATETIPNTEITFNADGSSEYLFQVVITYTYTTDGWPYAHVRAYTDNTTAVTPEFFLQSRQSSDGSKWKNTATLNWFLTGLSAASHTVEVLLFTVSNCQLSVLATSCVIFKL